MLQDLEEFDAQGQKLYALQEKQKNIQQSLSKLKNGGKENPNPYSEERKAAAVWAQTAEEADSVLRERCGEVWRKATKAQKDAIYSYTRGSGGFNRPLRGHDRFWGNFKGVGKVDLNNEGRGAAIKHMTDLIDKSTYDRDIWLQRGIETAEGAASFLGVPIEALEKWSPKKLEAELKRRLKPSMPSHHAEVPRGRGSAAIFFAFIAPRVQR